MSAPRIGLTWGAACDAGGEPFDTPDFYARAIDRAGGRVVLLENDVRSLATQIADVDGVTITGGQDVAPERYGATWGASVQPSDAARDDFEIALARRARDAMLPLLGICRGLHVTNVAFGGTLVPDIPTAFGTRALSHRRPGADDAERWALSPDHVVTPRPGSLLAEIAGAQSFPTNTIHHQSARDVARELREVAATPDGIVEALEATFAHPFFLLVQWHPELLGDDVSERIFARFVAAAAARPSPFSGRRTGR